jgi:hypothetical protein
MSKGLWRLDFRSRLLIGVAALAVSAPIAGKALAQEAKWQPWLEAGGAIGSDHSFGDVDMFIPVWQDQTSLLFGDLRGTFATSPTQEGNFGLGYRTQVSPDWILGGYGYFDIQNSRNDNLFYQGSVGAEALSVDWDLRLNGYFPFNSSGQSAGNNGKLEISGTSIGITHDEEKPLFGFDGEVGWRLPIFPADGDVDIRAFVGGYYFANSDVDTVAGPRGRLEVRLYDIDLLGVQSRLTVDGEVQWDSPRGTQGFGGLELRIPLGAVTGTPGSKLSPLDRRMVDRVQRDVDIVTQQFESNARPVVVDGLTGKTDTIVFAENGGTGNGTKGDPTSLEDAPALAAAKGKNAIIVVEGDGGPITLTGQPLQLADGQALLGGDSKVVLRDAGDSGIEATLHAPGERPTILGTNSAANLIQMYSGGQNRVTGLDMAGSFDAAIFGLNMQRAIITDNNIDPPAGNGIFLLNGGGPVPTSQFAYIARNSVDGAGSAGIAVKSYLADGLAHTQTVIIVDNTVTNAGSNGIEHTASDSGIASLSEAVLIAGNSISAVGGYGIANREALVAIPGAVSQRLAVYGNSLTGTGVHGIRVALASFQVGGLYQGIAIDGNSLGSVGGDGINFAESINSLSGAAIQNLSISGNTITSTGATGIAFSLAGSPLGSISQTVAIDGNSLGSIGASGIAFSEALASVSGAAIQNLSISGNAITSAGATGIAFSQAMLDLGSVSQTVAIDGNSLVFVGGSGIAFSEAFASVSGAVIQDVSIAGNSIDSADADGIDFAFAGTTLGSVSQAVAIDGNSLGSIASNGIAFAETIVSLPGVAISTVSIAGNTIDSAGGAGVTFALSAVDLGSLTQGVAVDGNALGSIGSDGIDVAESIVSIPGAAVSTVTIAGNTIAGTGGDGIALALSGVSLGGGLTQSAAIDGNALGAIASTGIRLIDNSVSVAGAMTSDVSASYNSIATAGSHGLYINLNGVALGGLSQAVRIDHNSVGAASSTAIFLHDSNVSVAGAVTSGISVSYNIASSAGGNGIEIALNGVSLGGVSQSVTVDRNAIGTVGGDGIAINSNLVAVSGPVVTNVSAGSNSVTSAGGRGLYLHMNNVSLGSLSQTLVVDHNGLGTVGSDGIAINSNIFNLSGPVVASVAANYNSLSSAGGRGIYLHMNDVSLPGLSQTLVVDHNNLGTVASDGIAIDSNIFNLSGPVVSGVAANYNSLRSAGGKGIYLHMNDVSLPGLSQTLVVDHNNLGTVASDGIAINSNIFAISGPVVDTVSASFNSLSSAGGRGIYLHMNDVSLAGLSQTLLVDHNNLGTVASDGIAINGNVFAISGPVIAAFSASYNSLAGAGRNGIYMHLNDSNLAGLSQTIAIDHNSLGPVASRGIALNDNIFSIGGTVSSGLSANANTLTSAGLTGIYFLQTINSATVVQTLAIDSNGISAAGSNGIASLLSVGNGGTVTQGGTIDANDVRSAAGNGVLVGVTAGGTGIATTDLSLSGNTLSRNTSNGFAGLANGVSASATFTLVSGSGNHFTSNGGAGAYLSNLNGTLTFHINGNDLSGNTGGQTATAGTVTITP